MATTRTRRTFAVLTALFLGALAVALLSRFSDSVSRNAPPPGDSAHTQAADPALTEPGPALLPPGREEAGRRPEPAAAGRERELELTSSQQGQLDALQEARARWREELAREVEALRRLKAPGQDRDRNAIREARRHVRAVRRAEPDPGAFLTGLPPEQRAMADPERRGPRAAIDETALSVEQRQRIDNLPRAQRVWDVKNRLELKGLRMQLYAARDEANAAGEQGAQEALDALRATRPNLDAIVAE